MNCSISKDIPQYTTTIESIVCQNKSLAYFSFIDETRRHCVSFADSISKGRITCQTCFWCRHPFSTVPIGCPIRYTPPSVLQTHVSELTKESYSVQSHLSVDAYAKIKNHDDLQKISTDFFETDGSFCSFNCCIAYINDNTHRPLYANSKFLLMRVYTLVYGKEPPLIQPAPSWRLLTAYGGHLSIEEFRDFSDLHYIDVGYMTRRPIISYPAGSVFEECFIF